MGVDLENFVPKNQSGIQHRVTPNVPEEIRNFRVGRLFSAQINIVKTRIEEQSLAECLIFFVHDVVKHKNVEICRS